MLTPFPAEEEPFLFLPGGFGKAGFPLEDGWCACSPVGFSRCSGCAGPWKAGVFLAGAAQSLRGAVPGCRDAATPGLSPTSSHPAWGQSLAPMTPQELVLWVSSPILGSDLNMKLGDAGEGAESGQEGSGSTQDCNSAPL